MARLSAIRIPSTSKTPKTAPVNAIRAALAATMLASAAPTFATDKETGRVVWEPNVSFDTPQLRITAAPLPIKYKIVIGASGGDSGVRDWMAGLDAATGKLLWRKFTIPAPGEPGSETWKDRNNAWQTGGGAVGGTGTYDPDTNQEIWGPRNPRPIF